MQLSVWPGSLQPYEDILSVARHAEATGWDGVWFADHFMADADLNGAPFQEAWTVLSALAAVVPRVRLAHYSLGRYQRTGNPEFLHVAEQMTRDIIQHATLSGDVVSWSHAEHRSTPGFTQTLTGYMQGAAGIGMHFLRMRASSKNRRISIRLLDDRD